jgi:hypothetical protein
MIQLIAMAALSAAPVSNEVTVYNQGFGFIKEVRVLNLAQGLQTVSVNDVAAMIQPSTVAIRSLTAPDSFSVLEQNYQYDLISPQAILNKSVGQRVRFVRHFGANADVLEGTLISAPNAIVGGAEGGSFQTYNGMVIKTDDGRIILNPTGEIEVLTLPKGLISQPTLLWDLDSQRAGQNTIELSYLTGGMSWNADYVMTLDGTGKADFRGWVTVNNQSGVTFENAKMKLLAGDVNIAPNVMNMNSMAKDARGGFAGAGGQFQEQSLFEYHLYTLQRPATIRNKETKQISLLEATGVPFSKRIILDATRSIGRWYPAEGEVGTGNISPQVRVEFVNDEKSGLGIPLPKGTVRMYQRDNSGSSQMLGEDNIEHTPKNERLSLVVGRSFDIVGERKRTNFHRIDTNTVEESFEVEVRNRKDTPETVFVVERSWADWKMIQKNMDFTKLDANTFQFQVDLKAGETKKVDYTIRENW